MNFDWSLMQAALPEIILAASILVILLAGAFAPERRATYYVRRLAQASLLVTFFLILEGTQLPQMFAFPRLMEVGNVPMHAMFINDGFAIFSKAVLVAMTFLCIFLARDYLSRLKIMSFEYYVMMLLVLLGGMILVSAHDLLVFYIGLELMSFSLYILTAYHRRSLRASEAGLKYFLLGSLASGFILYGMSLFYGLTGSTSFEAIQLAMVDGQLISEQRMMMSMAMVMMLVGMLFKMSSVPFHVWTPDVYEGAPTPVTAFMSIVPKIATIAAFVRVLAEPMAYLKADWQPILIIVAVLTMAMGSIVAIMQTNIKRLLAYSAIGNAGFVMVPMLTGTSEGYAAVLTYLVIYGITLVGIFAVILSFRNREMFLEDVSHLRGIAKQSPKLSFVFMLLLFSLSGVPPFAGFFGKLFAFKAAMNAGFVWLAVVAVVFSVVSAYYSLKIIKAMYFEEGGRTISPDQPKGLGYLAGFALVVVLALSMFADTLVNATGQASRGLYSNTVPQTTQVEIVDENPHA